MEFEIEKTQRTVWKVKDRIDFLEKMLPLLKIEEEEIAEIKEQLQEHDFDYLEIASYVFGGKDEQPSAALVFDGKKDVYWDIFYADKSKQIIEKIKELSLQEVQMEYIRGLTQRDWRKRLKAIYGFDPKELGLF